MSQRSGNRVLNLVDCGAFACGLALDLLVCGIGAVVCGVCAVQDEVLSFA